MSNVKKRVKEVNQPYGGYLKVSEFQKISLNDEVTLKEEENINSGLVGTVVDYMTRFLNGTPANKSFEISIRGAAIIGKKDLAIKMLSNIVGLDSKSIINACKLVGFDVLYRTGENKNYKKVEEINPDKDTIFNIITMINRTNRFLNQYGPKVADGITFEGAYTNVITAGDADFITEDTIWDIKTSINKINSKQTLQILTYYLMGCRTDYLNARYGFIKNITKLGIFNPRRNEVYIKNINEIDKSIIEKVKREVIGYEE